MEDDFLRVQIRMYHNKELPALIGLPKATLNRDLKPHRKVLGRRIGYYWTFDQIRKILKMFAIPYVIV
jgi:hypothetical protein